MEISERLEKCEFLIEATRTEEHFLWKECVQEFKWCSDKQWEQGHGNVVRVGEIGDRPVNLTLTWNKIKGIPVCFYDCCSQVVDWKMIEEWLDKNFTRKYNGRRAICDAMNFSHCMNYIDEKIKI